MTRRCFLPLLTILALAMGLATAPAIASEPAPPQKNLFAPSTASTVQPAMASPPSLFDRTLGYAQQQQRALYRQLASVVREVKSEQTFTAVSILVLLSFLYGVFHAVGPGHGKAVISAYLLANERAVKRGIALSFAASLAQAISAIALVSVVLFAMKGLGVTTKQSMGIMTTISAWLIVAIGAWMSWSTLRGLVGIRAHDHGGGECGHDHHVQPTQLADRFSWTNAGSIIAAIGLRPCSGAIFVLLFANTIGLYVAGVWSTFAMALGTAITVSALAVLTLLSKRLAVHLVGDKNRLAGWIYQGLSIAGSLAVLGLGIVLVLAASAPQTPLP